MPEWIVLQFALAKIGAILVTVNTSLRAREIEYLLRQSESETLFTIAGFKGVDYMAEFREAKSAHVKRVFFIGDPCPADATPVRATPRRWPNASRTPCSTNASPRSAWTM